MTVTPLLSCSDQQQDVVVFGRDQRVEPGLILGSDRFDRQF